MSAKQHYGLRWIFLGLRHGISKWRCKKALSEQNSNTRIWSTLTENGASIVVQGTTILTSIPMLRRDIAVWRYIKITFFLSHLHPANLVCVPPLYILTWCSHTSTPIRLEEYPPFAVDQGHCKRSVYLFVYSFPDSCFMNDISQTRVAEIKSKILDSAIYLDYQTCNKLS